MYELRKKIAQNANFHNYRDFMMQLLNRFDYTVDDCAEFHHSVLEEVVPIASKIYQERKEKLGLDELKPYDLDVDLLGRSPLKPYNEVHELIDKTIEALDKSSPFFAQCVATMHHMRRLDLYSRKGKSPGGYNMTLPETGVPFVFMNGAGTQNDVHTMVHEAGHAVHSILMHELPYYFDTEIPSETAELASMGMEFLSMPHWDKFYNPEDHKRAIRHQLESVILILPWIAVVDKFQHWIYTEQDWSIEKTLQYWHELHKMYFPMINWEGYDTYRSHLWHRQLHIFEIPFYYIEYGIAQLGAIGLWKNYHMQPDKAIEDYMHALALGNTVTIPEMYRTAGVNFDFSAKHIKELMDFVLLHL
jgi:oligoendopeptidase F